MILPGLSFESTARTHVGKVRTLNEDAFVDRPLVGLWAVADGMGGHEAGEVASGLISESLSQVDTLSSGYAFLDEVRESVMRVNRTLIARASHLAPGTVIGSTVVIMLAYGGHYACLWAGDSRAYLLRDGLFLRLSRDHSMVQELIDTGNLSQADARHYKRSNVITRAVGVHDDLVIDMNQGAIEPGDVYLLCSDGLTGMMEDFEIAKVLAQDDLEAAADSLIATTLERGAKDNVTVVIVRAAANPDKTLDGVTSAWGR
ncbi:protein phosphatase 2C domain-containing protein [soil metagenome]